LELCYEKFSSWKIHVGYISGVKTKPIDTKADDYATALKEWELDNSKIIT